MNEQCNHKVVEFLVGGRGQWCTECGGIYYFGPGAHWVLPKNLIRTPVSPVSVNPVEDAFYENIESQIEAKST